MPAAWIGGTWIAENVMELPLSLAFGTRHTEVLGAARLVGLPGIDFLIVLPSSLIAGWICGSLKRSTALGGLIATGVFLAVGAHALVPETTGRVGVAGVQPAIPDGESRAMPFSLATRARVESRLDALTGEAIAQGADLVVWPEAPNNLFNRRLPRRRDRLKELLRKGHAELLISGKDLMPEGELFSVVSHLADGRFGVDARKSRTVHFAESDLDRGQPTVIATGPAKVGVAICLESIFAHHVGALVRGGAEVLVVATDDSSFGYGALQQWHIAFAVARAVEAGRSLFLLGNHGISLATDPTGKVRHVDWTGHRAQVYAWDVEKSSALMLSLRGGRSAVFFLVGLLLMRGIAARRRHESGREGGGRILDAGILIGGATLSIVFGAVLAVFIAAATHGRTSSEVWSDVLRRYRGEGAGMGLGSAFQQRSSHTCGAAALAYVLTFLGDEVFESDLVRIRTPGEQGGYSLLELQQLARTRGLDARGFKGGWDDLPSEGRPPVIAHLSAGHFVVVHQTESDRVLFFDPAKGQLVTMGRNRFEAEWSRKYLGFFTLSEEELEGTMDRSS
jgi:hypothetical protein